MKGRFSFSARGRRIAALAPALALVGCAGVEKPLPHRRALERLRLLEDLDATRPSELALGIELAHELLLDDDDAPAFARSRAAAELGRWGAARPPLVAHVERGPASAEEVDRRRAERIAQALHEAEERRGVLARGATLEAREEQSHRGTIATLGALRGGSLATEVRALALCGALHEEERSAALRAELAAACDALAAEALPALLATALRRGDPAPAVRVALAEAWLALHRRAGFAALFACCAEDSSEEMRCLLVAEASHRPPRELEALGVVPWLQARAAAESSSSSSRFAARALRTLGIAVAER